MNRREWGQLTLGGVVGAASIPPLFGATATPSPSPTPTPSAKATPHPTPVRALPLAYKGVEVGLHSRAFRHQPLEEAVKALRLADVGSCALWQGHLEPKDLLDTQGARDQLRRFRLTTPIEDCAKVRARFAAAGLTLTAYRFDFDDDAFQDAEIERVFLMARTLGCKRIVTIVHPMLIPPIDFFARQYAIRVGLLAQKDGAQVAPILPADLPRIFKGGSRQMAISLDLGALVSAKVDAVAYLRAHHEQMLSVHLRDRKAGSTDDLPLGAGDAQVRAILTLLRQKRWPIATYIECDYDAQEYLTEARNALALVKQALDE
jgi:sugar phosphate isomerase/epimerase